ncbi:MAG: UDP-N-acetylglucosamine 1-carboxyvinyltransferase [Candidatus Niyogibacteria bacterium]|nr:UDP-N-acetylglucosamine 1-carboxyvinyltransferase [Candidatus Niyogibacteria bacterium]
MKFIVQGLAGKRLAGTIPVLGSKNACLKVFAAAILTSEPVIIKNAPLIEDIFRMRELLASLGAEVENRGRVFRIVAKNIKTRALDDGIAKSLRASIVLAGPMLARFGEVQFSYPGGCVIGKRPIDLFLDGFKKLGARVTSDKQGNRFTVKAKRLRGANICFRLVSVGGTETLMMAATLAAGRTTLHNAAQEPEIIALADFLNKCGARIKGAGTNTITVDGVRSLHGGVFQTPPDRLETGSFAIMGALLGDKLKITNCNPAHILGVIEHLESMGASIKKGRTWLEVTRAKKPLPVNLKTHEYPGFPTDLQAPFAVLLTQAYGTSMLFETVFDGRLTYLEDLNRMGADIVPCDAHRAVFHGPRSLRDREADAPDLRAGLAFIFAALIAKGESIIHNAYNIDRGYEKIEDRFSGIGVNIKRV